MRINVKKYLRHSSVLIAFTQGLIIYGNGVLPLDLKLFYPLLLINLLIVFSWKPIIVTKYFVFLIAFLLIHSFGTILVLHTNPMYPISQIIGISICLLYFMQIVHHLNPLDLFDLYAKYALFFAIVALVFFPFGLIDKEPFVRLDGVMTEPSKFGLVTFPAFIYFIRNRKVIPSIILGLSLLIAQSSIGYLGILLGFLFLIIGYGNLKLSLATIALFFIAFPVLTQNKKFVDRFDSLIENVQKFNNNKISNDANISVFVLLKSAMVAKENVKNHPLGTGIGTFSYWHDVYTPKFDLPNYADPSKTDALSYNRQDANSLGLRIISDFGLLGILFILSILFLTAYLLLRKNEPSVKIVNICILVYVWVKLFRMGHYFTEEMYFFVCILVMINSRKMSKLHAYS